MTGRGMSAPPVTSADHLDRAGELLDQAVEELEGVEDAVADWSRDSVVMLRAEIRVARRRCRNVRRLAVAPPGPGAA